MMIKKNIWFVATLFVLSTLLLVAWSGPAAINFEPAADDEPTELKIAVGVLFLEEAWTTSMLQSLERVIAESPHGLTITYDLVEDVSYADSEKILDQIASTGEYDIIWTHSTYTDAVRVLMEEYPDIAWAVAGSGNEALGGNMWYMDYYPYDGAYLLGVLGGLLTETNSIGTVAEFPFPSLVAVNNAYEAGAKSVNPDVEVQVSYIESWFDPTKAIESATAQIANGADFMFAQPIGPIEACLDAEIWCAGHYVDQSDFGPEVVVSSNLTMWDPHWQTLIDAWWEYTVNDVAYDAPLEKVDFSASEGGNDIFPINDMDGAISEDVIEQVMEVRQQIIDGELIVELDTGESE